MNTKHFKAPWSTSLKVVSALMTLLCLGYALFGRGTEASASLGYLWRATVPTAVFIGGLLFTIRGYTITPDEILIHRLFWATRLSRAGLDSARVEPEALQGSIRYFGNGGFFSVSGWFWSPSLRKYRAFLTDSKRAVVLRYANRTIVVSPDSPEAFVSELSKSASAV